MPECVQCLMNKPGERLSETPLKHTFTLLRAQASIAPTTTVTVELGTTLAA